MNIQSWNKTCQIECFLLACQTFQLYRITNLKMSESGFVIQCNIFCLLESPWWAGCVNFNADHDEIDEKQWRWRRTLWLWGWEFIISFKLLSQQIYFWCRLLWVGHFDKPDNPSPLLDLLCWAPCKSQAPPTRISFKELSPKLKIQP